MYILKNVFIIFSVTLILLYQQVVTVVRYMLFKKKSLSHYMLWSTGLDDWVMYVLDALIGIYRKIDR